MGRKKFFQGCTEAQLNSQFSDLSYFINKFVQKIELTYPSVHESLPPYISDLYNLYRMTITQMAIVYLSSVIMWICGLLSPLVLLPCISSNVSTTYIIHMDSAAMPNDFSDRRTWFAATLASAVAADASATDISVDSKLVYVYDNAIDGFAALLSSAELGRLKTSRGFLACYPDMPLKKDTTHTPDFLHLSEDFGIWPASKQGEDIVIGVVDTGISPESMSFGDDGFSEVPSSWRGACEQGEDFSSASCNRKLIGARSFNKGLMANNPKLRIAVNSPRDMEGHGTHTSSTAGGSYVAGVSSFFGYAPGVARGIAPRARIAMYKALWEEGSVSSDAIAAIDRAISDGVDVISLSFGQDNIPLYKDPIAIAGFAAMEKGIFVTTSAGNEGPLLGRLHNGIPWVLTVGASTIDRQFAGVVTLGDGTTISGQSMYLGSPTPKLPLTFMGKCDDFKLIEKAQHLMVVCAVAAQAIYAAFENVVSANVTAGIFISDGSLDDLYDDKSGPIAIVNVQDGSTILDYIKMSSKPTAGLMFRKTILGTKPVPTIASFSSRGPASACPAVLKPDVVAPGSLIFAAWAQNVSVSFANHRAWYSPFNIISGTSMACPHAAGVAGLLKAAHPQWSPAAIKSAIMTTANHLDNTGAPIKDLGKGKQKATPLAMGSGHIEPNKAIDPGLVYDADAEDYVKLLCAMNYTENQIKLITRRTKFASCARAGGSLDLNYPSFIASLDADAATTTSKFVQAFRRTVTNVGYAVATYRAEVTEMKRFAIKVIPDKLEFHETYEKQSFSVIIEGKLGYSKAKKVSLHSSLSWVDDEKKHVVRSPIVMTTKTGGD